jgi:hypothetical protein
MNPRPNLSTSTPWPEHAIPQHWVESLFKKMALTYGAKFVDQWRGHDPVEVKQHWAVMLGKLSTVELVRGVEQLATRPWPPTLPEFMALCRPAVDPQVAFHEALEQGIRRERGEDDVWSSPALFWAWRRIGAYNFATMAYEVIRPRWEAALAAEMAKEDQLPVPPNLAALPAPGQARTPPERAHEILVDYRDNGIKDAAEVAGDGLEWARRIFARRDRGEVLYLAQLEEAEKVLGKR